LGLDDARTGDEEEGLVQPDFKAAQLHASLPPMTLSAGSGTRSLCCSIAALMNDVNSGWPSRGVEVNSGWYWQPKNHGWSASSAISVRSSALVLALTSRPAASSRGT